MLEPWQRFHFLRPDILWLLAPFLLGLCALFFRAGQGSPWRRVIRSELLVHLERQSRASRLPWPELLALALGVGATVCAAGPTYRAQAETGDPAASPLVVVFELSRTMAKTDVSPSRAERARLELLDLLRARPNSPTALVVVAGTAHILMPFTDDVGALLPYIEALSPELMPSDGQNFSAAAKLVRKLVASSPVPPAVLLVSDGLPAPEVAAFSALAEEKKLGLVALSLGHEDAERSALHRAVATDVELSFGSRDIKRLLSALANARASSVKADDTRFWQDEASVWAWPLALGLALWFRRGFRLSSRARVAPNPHRARNAERTRATLAAVVFSLTSGCSPAVESIWLTPDQQGRLAFERGQYLVAADRFADPRWKGLSFYAAEKWDAAAAALVGLDDAEALFLLGNAYAEGGKLQSAVHAYERALQERPTFRAARRNFERIDRLLHSLQEDTDIESAKKIEKDHGDARTRVDKDTLAPKGTPTAHSAEGKSEATVEESKLWLERLSTDPAEFLKRKLAAQAVKGEAP